MNIAEILLTWR